MHFSSTLSNALHRSEKLVIDNSPAILTAIGVVGTVSTAILTGKATLKASVILNENRNFATFPHAAEALDARTKVALVWREYIPAVGVGVLTVTCIIGANRVGSRRAAAMAAAYALSENRIAEYKEKVVKQFGKAQSQKVRDELAQDQVTKNPPKSGEVLITGNGDVLFIDSLTGRYFQSTVETVKKAQNDTNYQILHEDYSSLSDFYDRLGLSPTPYSEEVGWTHEEQLEVTFSTCLTPDHRPCISLDYVVMPIRGYDRLR